LVIKQQSTRATGLTDEAVTDAVSDIRAATESPEAVVTSGDRDGLG
jgi:hypothetical protein